MDIFDKFDLNLELVDVSNPASRKLWDIVPSTPASKAIINTARRLACTQEFCMLSDGELMRKAARLHGDLER